LTSFLLGWVQAECRRLHSLVWPPVRCLRGICPLASAVPLPLVLELQHRHHQQRVGVFHRRLHREETPNRERLNRGVDVSLAGVTEQS